MARMRHSKIAGRATSAQTSRARF